MSPLQINIQLCILHLSVCKGLKDLNLLEAQCISEPFCYGCILRLDASSHLDYFPGSCSGFSLYACLNMMQMLRELNSPLESLQTTSSLLDL